MATIKFLLQKPYQSGTKKLNDQETRVYAFLILSRELKTKIKTEHVVYPKEWDFRLQQKKELKGSQAGLTEENKRIRSFNEKLRGLKRDIESQYSQIKESYPDLPFSEVARMLKEYGKTKAIPYNEKAKGFYDIYDEFLASLDGLASPRTIQKFGTLKISLMDFGKQNDKYKTLSFAMINKSFVDDYTKFLRDQKPRGRQKSRPEGTQTGLLNDTVMKYVETLKSFLKWAEERPSEQKPYNMYGQYQNFKITGKRREKRATDIVTLTLSELRQFYTFDFTKVESLTRKSQQALERVRDLFCFACFTGQRWSDIELLDKTEIEGEVWTFEAFKTKKLTEIHFVGYAAPAIDILKKYDYKLPKISLQKFNIALKKAAEVAGINDPVKIRRYVGIREITIEKPKSQFLGSHAGRRTCVSILLNDYNLNISHVQQITGHSDISTLQKYINADNEARKSAMAQTQRIDVPLKVVKDTAV